MIKGALKDRLDYLRREAEIDYKKLYEEAMHTLEGIYSDMGDGKVRTKIMTVGEDGMGSIHVPMLKPFSEVRFTWEQL